LYNNLYVDCEYTLNVKYIVLKTTPAPTLVLIKNIHSWSCWKSRTPVEVDTGTPASDVAKPLNYKTKTGQAKTKTTFSRPRPAFLKTIKLLT